MADIEKVIKNTIKKGKVKIGTKQTKQAIKDGSAKIVLISKNCPYFGEINNLLKKNKIPLYETDTNSIDLGYMCGKAFAVSVFAVIDDGGSNILNIIKK
jgi:large subunit ribosomal protein L30e